MIYLITILAYLLILTGIGVYRSGKVKNQDDFAIAGRTLSPWVMVLTMLAVWIGTGSIVGNAGEAYRNGMQALMLPLGGLIGMTMLALIANRARSIEMKSVPEIIGSRFGPTARALAVVSLILGYLVIVSYQFKAGGAVLDVILRREDGSSIFPNAAVPVFIAAAFIILYTMLAGLSSLAYMDIITGSIIVFSVVVSFPVLLHQAGGFEGMRAAFEAKGWTGHMRPWGAYGGIALINSILPAFLLVMGDANQYQRIFASRSAKGATRAVTVLIFLAFGIEVLIIADAWVASSLTTAGLEEGGHVLIHAARHHLPLVLGLIFLATVVGIIFSTADSFLLIPATTFVNDVYLRYIDRDAPNRRVLLVSRILVVFFGLVALWINFRFFSRGETFFQRALYAYTIYGASITPAVIAAMFWQRATRAGVIGAMLTGIGITLMWSELLKTRIPAPFNELDAVLPAIVSSVAVLVVVSLVTSRPPKDGAAEGRA